MSIQAVGWVLDQEDLPARPKLVLVAIANHARNTDGYCWLNAETIASEAACSPRGVFNFVGDLIRNGFLRKAPRKGDDGKQRANDYWILFKREPAKWVKRTGDEVDEEIEDAEPADHDQDQTQDIVVPDAPHACGENGTVDDSVHAASPTLAVGPDAPACQHKDSAEPSKTNPKSRGLEKSEPRGYRPPPPPPLDPVGATVVGVTGQIYFAYLGSRAYDAWKAFKERETGRPFNLQTSKNGRMGWYFPMLFPPEEKPQPAPQDHSHELDPPYSKTG